MPSRFRRERIEICSAAFGLEPLEGRRMLACSHPVEMIEITRLDGGESSWVRADDPFGGTGEGCGGADASETVRPAWDSAGRDDDLYDFGQDRGPEIDDEAEYEVGARGPAGIEPRDSTGNSALRPVYDSVPAVVETEIRVDAGGADSGGAVSAGESDVQVVAILPPPTSGVAWLGDGLVCGSAPSFTSGASAPTRALVAVSLVGAEAPSWTDVVALPA
jgi:hypothetical protein